MNKAQLALLLGGVALVIMLYQLPRVVVENEALDEQVAGTHNFNMPEEVRSRIQDLRMKWESSTGSEKKLNFADSLATIYLDYQVLDSGIWFADYLKSANQTEWEVRVADLFFRAFQLSDDPVKAREIGERAGLELRKLIEKFPESSSLKNRLALTLVATENPMAGIQMLRDILEEEPGNLEAIKNLGILSIQSGQFSKAEDRFKDFLSIDSTDEEALFYLGMSQIEQGNAQGMEIMRKLSTSENPAIKSLATEYLEN